MRHATHCKFCKKPITLEIDDEYAKLGDPFKLLGLAACNVCADLRIEKRTLEAKIKRVVMTFFMTKLKDRAKINDSTRSTLIEYTQKYANMIARWHHKDGMAWDEECVNLLMEKPDKWNIIIGELWKLYTGWEKEGEKA